MKLEIICSAFLMCGPRAHASTINLGTADAFAVAAGSTVTNTGPTVVQGDLGVWPGSAITGFPPGTVTDGTIHAADAVAMQAQSDITMAYNDAALLPCGTDLTGQNLGGLTLGPGVYCFASSAQLT
jgi:Ice-binding-like